MDFFSQSNSGNSIIDLIPQENDQVSILEERNRDYDYYDEDTSVCAAVFTNYISDDMKK